MPDNSPDANCDYQKAPFFNVLAAYWIQFMTHDWFSHMEEGHNAPEMMEVGCTTQLVNNVETPLTPDEIQKLGCRPADRVDKTYVLQDSPPDQFTSGGTKYLTRAPKTFANNNTAWWDASQLYGYDERLGEAGEARSEGPGEDAAGAGDRSRGAAICRCCRRAIPSSRNGPGRSRWRFPTTGRSG